MENKPKKMKFFLPHRYDYSPGVHIDLENYYYSKFHCRDWDEAYNKLSGREFDRLMTILDSINDMPPKDVLSIYLEWNGINSSVDSIIEHYQDGDLDDYLNDEGIIGHTKYIKNILSQDKSLTLARRGDYSVEKIDRRYNILNKKNRMVSASTNKKEALSNLRRFANNQPVEGAEDPSAGYSWWVGDRHGHTIRSRDTDIELYPSVAEAIKAAKAAARADESFEGICTAAVQQGYLTIDVITFDK